MCSRCDSGQVVKIRAIQAEIKALKKEMQGAVKARQARALERRDSFSSFGDEVTEHPLETHASFAFSQVSVVLLFAWCSSRRD